jgi:glycosyltransferase involved in cell wall biosynthesis
MPVVLSIIIPTKDRNDIFFKTLKNAYSAIADIDAEIIVINDSRTNTIEVDALYQSKVIVYRNPKRGVASARNLGAAKAKANLLLFLDDDMLISQQNIQTTLKLHQAYNNCCINLNWIYPPHLTEKIVHTQFGRYLIHYGFTSLKGWNKGEFWSNDHLFKTSGITSQYLSMEKKIFDEMGGYSENFPHAGFEDFEFAQRLKQKDINFYIYPLSMVHHNEEDRLQVKPWLQRKKRGGETRRVAVEMGFNYIAIRYSSFKTFILSSIVFFKSIIMVGISILPNVKLLDGVYFKLVNILLAAAIFEGYTTKKLNN